MSRFAEATLSIDLTKIAENARCVVDGLPGVEIVGVTKVTCGTPEVARAMLAGGVAALGESRLENVQRLRDAGIDAPVWLLRAPSPALAEETVRLTDVSLVSELACVAALDAAAAAAGCRYQVVAMVDIGDLREGMMPQTLPGFLREAERFTNVDIVGLGASLTCYGAIVPDQTNLGLLLALAEDARREFGRPLLVSAGSSTSIEPVAAGRVAAGVDNLRIGEAIVLGVDPATREPVPGFGLHTDALTLSVPVIECQVKPSVPIGTSAQDAFGNRPSFEDVGSRRRAICALGRQDAPPESLTPLDPRVRVLGASSDHLVLDVGDLPQAPAIGSTLEFRPGYSAALALFTSPYVAKEFIGG